MSTLKHIIKQTGVPRLLRRILSRRYRREHALSKRLIHDIHLLGFDATRNRHELSTDSSRKYLNLEWHVEEVVRLAARLGVFESQPLRVLDIGCGSGCFLFALKSVGHDVLGLDLPDTPLYNDMVQLLGIQRVDHRVEAFQTLPNTGLPFDFITAFSICFDLHATDKVWGPREWKFFLEDCSTRLRPGGRVFLNFNPKTSMPFDFIPDEVAATLRHMPGATLTSSKEFFTLKV